MAKHVFVFATEDPLTAGVGTGNVVPGGSERSPGAASAFVVFDVLIRGAGLGVAFGIATGRKVPWKVPGSGSTGLATMPNYAFVPSAVHRIATGVPEADVVPRSVGPSRRTGNATTGKNMGVLGAFKEHRNGTIRKPSIGNNLWRRLPTRRNQ